MIEKRRFCPPLKFFHVFYLQQLEQQGVLLTSTFDILTLYMITVLKTVGKFSISFVSCDSSTAAVSVQATLNAVCILDCLGTSWASYHKALHCSIGLQFLLCRAGVWGVCFVCF